MQEFQMTAKTFKGLEPVLADELLAIGANNIEIGRRAVSFTGDLAVLYRANFWLRTATRILVPITEFRAKDADAVYEQCKSIDWSQFMTVNTSFIIDATVYSETFRHSRYVTYRVKDAIADYWMEHAGKRPSVQITDPDLYLNVHIAGDIVTISLDSSGESLHKRGYRVATTEAPLSETLAAGMLLLAGWKGESDFYDPMCGSGTLGIEAALIALNIAPGIFRKGFAFERWIDFNADLWEEISTDDSNDREFHHHIYLSDASYYAVQAALKNVHSASLDKYISVRQIRLEELRLTQPETSEDTPKALRTDIPKALRTDAKASLVVINPPYGERLTPNAYRREQQDPVLPLYRAIGTALKHQFTGSTAWVISSNEDALKCIGLKPSERLHLMNGELECLYNKYELFEGEHRDFKRAQADRKPFDGHKPSDHKPSDRKPFDRKPSDRKPSDRKQFGERKDFKSHGTNPDRKLQLPASGRENRQVSFDAERPQQTARVLRRRTK